MPNDYSSRQGQTQGQGQGQGQSTTDKASEFARSAGQQVQEKSKDIVGDAQKKIKEGQEQVGKVIETLDKQLRENPWPIVAGVAIGAFILGSIVSKSNNK
jgi:ElaB/YqjD/DUF883 family membrane-anchored ribosome-binding protein